MQSSESIATHLPADLSAMPADASTLFATMFAAAPLAMLLVSESGHIVLANDQASELLGYAPRELVDRPVDSLVPDESRERHGPMRDFFLANQEPRRMRPGRAVSAVGADGQLIPVEVSLTPIPTTGGTLVIAAVVDRTERHSVERSLQDQADELSRSNRDLADFAYVAAHDLRAPLRAIESLANFVLEDSGEALGSQSQRDVAEIVNRAQRLMEQLDVLLAYARIGSDHRRPEPVDTCRLLRDLADLYVPADTFTVDLDDDLPVVEAPTAAVELVFRNLLMNAVKHHDQPTGRITVTWRDDEDVWRFLVADDGPGIDPEHAEAVFALFRTLQRRSGDASSGMGLSLVRRTMETLGGTVRLLPHEGRGATFEVCWPRQ